jgi:ribosome biogenesis GTPase
LYARIVTVTIRDRDRAMELRALGFDHWFQKQQENLQKPGYCVARVTAVNRDRYLVRNEHSEVPAELAGRLLFSAKSSVNLPCVGDWVFVQYHNSDTFAIIHDLLPRKSVLRRKSAGKKIDYQMIASNIDVAFIVQSCDFNFNLRRLERYLVMIHEGQVEPVILLTKSDLVSPEDIDRMISQVRQSSVTCKIIALSNITGFGLDLVRQVLEAGKTYCLLGSSGVGKTTLLNHLLGRELFETKEVRQKDGKGRHVTASRQLIILDKGAMLIDTPGMREMGIIDVNAGMDESFSDIYEYAKSCRFTDCTHTKEIGCKVRAALEDGELSEERYRSYLSLRRESQFHQLSYLERRKKDKKLSKLIKTSKKYFKKK